jgi:hypothetical protein
VKRANPTRLEVRGRCAETLKRSSLARWRQLTRAAQLLETYRVEALALFQVNQVGRVAAERTIALILTASGIAIGAGINADTELVGAALAPVVLFLLSYTFQQYAEVSVTGAARAVLERLVADQLGGTYGLIYEYAVAGVRKRPPLVRSVRILQVVTGFAVAVVLVVGGAVAFGGNHSWLIAAGYSIGVLVGAATAGTSFQAMLNSGREATRQIEQRLGISGPTTSPDRTP